MGVLGSQGGKYDKPQSVGILQWSDFFNKLSVLVSMVICLDILTVRFLKRKRTVLLKDAWKSLKNNKILVI